LYRSATGTSPFGDADTLSILSALATRTPVPPHQIVPTLPRMFSGLVMRLLAKDPDDRPQSAREVVEAIEALERGETEAADACPPQEPAPPPAPAAAEAGHKPEGERPPRVRVRRRRKRPEPGRHSDLWALAAGAAMLVVSALVLLLVL